MFEFVTGLGECRKMKGGPKELIRRISTRLPPYIREAKKDGFRTSMHRWPDPDLAFLSFVLDYLRANTRTLSEILDEPLVEALLRPCVSGRPTKWMQSIRPHCLLSLLVWRRIFVGHMGPLLGDLWAQCPRVYRCGQPAPRLRGA